MYQVVFHNFSYVWQEKTSFLPIQGLVHFDFYNRREECSQRLDVRGPGVEPGIDTVNGDCFLGAFFS